MPTNPNCKHDRGFKCAEINPEIGYKFYCVHVCGYFMDFNPALYPEGVAFNKKFGLGGKELPKLKSSEVDIATLKMGS